MAPDREFDLVIFGATGFTGRQAADYLHHRAPQGLRWAVAGRDADRLASVAAGAPVIVADADDQTALDALARRTRVVLTTAGPFMNFGKKLVGACVRAGTHYTDIGGEGPWIRWLIDRHDGEAARRQIRIVPGCGVCSAPPDVAVNLLDRLLGETLREARTFVRAAGGMLNGGTVAAESFGRTSGDHNAGRDPFLLSATPSRPIERWERDPRGIRYNREAGAWAIPSPMGRSDTQIIRRSFDLKGRDLRVQEYMVFSGGAGVAQALGVDAAMAAFRALLGFGPTRRWLERKMPPGTGPSEAVMDAGFYECRIVGRSDDARSGEVTVRFTGDPGNRVTVLSVCEAALALALDEAELPARYGVLTPSVAMGAAYATRLQSGGMIVTSQVAHPAAANSIPGGNFQSQSLLAAPTATTVFRSSALVALIRRSAFACRR